MRSDWLEGFLTFSKSMNFTHAATAMNISQPALFVKVRQLAESLGQPLYRKTGRDLTLTPAGELVAAYARDQHERALAFVEMLKTGANRSPVVLCAGTGAYLYLLGPAISRFAQTSEHPLNLVTGNMDRTIAMVRSGEAHLGVTALDGLPDGLVATPLTDVDQILVLPPDHRLTKRRTVTLADLQDEALIVPPPDRPHRTMLNRMLMDAGVTWRVAVEANGWDLILHFVGLGIGSAIVNGNCRVPTGLAAKPLIELPRIRYHIVERDEVRRHPGVQALWTLLLDIANDWQLNR